MNDQASALREARPARMTRLPVPFVLVTGGKGGVGKTLLSTNLAVGLAQTERRVLLVDFDLALANVHVVLGLRPEKTLEDWYAGEADLEDCLTEGPCGIVVLAAGAGAHAMARPDRARRDRLMSELRRLARGFDVVVGDSAAGIGPDMLATTAAADLVLVATAPEPAAMTDAFGVIKALDHWSLEAGEEVPTPELFLNFVSGHGEADRLHGKLREICERFLSRSPRSAGWMPRSGVVRASACDGTPAILRDPDSTAGGCLRRVVLRVGRFLDRAAPEVVSL